MARYMKENMKKFFKKHGTTKMHCRQCRSEFTTQCDLVVQQNQSYDSIDGSKAFPIFQVCLNKGHMQSVGYTRPVDFTTKESETKVDERTFEEQTLESDMEYRELMKELNAD